MAVYECGFFPLASYGKNFYGNSSLETLSILNNNKFSLSRIDCLLSESISFHKCNFIITCNAVILQAL